MMLNLITPLQYLACGNTILEMLLRVNIPFQGVQATRDGKAVVQPTPSTNIPEVFP